MFSFTLANVPLGKMFYVSGVCVIGQINIYDRLSQMECCRWLRDLASIGTVSGLYPNSVQRNMRLLNKYNRSVSF